MIDDEDSLIRRALDHSGYGHVHEIEENLIECFRDYVDSGIWFNLTLDDIDGISTADMCRALLNIKHR